LATLHKSLQSEALKLVFWQLIMTTALSVIIFIINGLNKGISTLLGGSAYIVPNFLFAWRIFSYSGHRLMDQFLFKFMVGEFTKLLLSVVSFVLMVKYLPVNIVFVIIGYIFAIFSFLFICGWYFSQGASSKSSTRASS